MSGSSDRGDTGEETITAPPSTSVMGGNAQEAREHAERGCGHEEAEDDRSMSSTRKSGSITAMAVVTLYGSRAATSATTRAIAERVRAERRSN